MQRLPVTQQFAGVQILRFVAAMLVVVMHTTQAISIHITGQGPGHYWANGSAGVDIFFVISGFVMAMSTPVPQPGGRDRLAGAWTFMKRRLLRIVPLYWFYTLLKILLLLAVPALAMRSSLDASHLQASLLFIPAMSPWGLIEPSLPVGWTLNFEMLFYALFALALALGAPRIRFCFFTLLLIFIAGQYAQDSVPLTFYARSIVFEFIVGMCIAHALQRYGTTAVPPAMGLLPIAIGLLLMFGISWNQSADRFLTWGSAGALLVLGAIWMEPWIERSRAAATLSFLGDTSYSIYLSHTFVVPMAVRIFKEIGVQNSFIIVPAVGLVVIVCGCASYMWLERPMTNALKRALFRVPKLSYQTPGK